ncbi:MAG: DinB family protein [Chloroflexota bacterium]
MNDLIWMTDEQRTGRPFSGPEKVVLAGFMDFQRDTLIWKVSGLTDDQASRAFPPSGMTLAGLVKHCAYVERWWFQRVFDNRDVWILWLDGDESLEWKLAPGETLADVVALYRQEIAISREIVAAHDLGEHARFPARAQHSLRRILIHMIEETARHNGHADLMREQVDGQTGE